MTGNSNDKKLYVNKSGAMIFIKKMENSKNKKYIINKTLSNNNLLSNNINESKKNKQNICTSFRQNNGLGIMGNKLQNTISFGNNNLIKTKINDTHNIKKSQNKNEKMNYKHHNNILTTNNMGLM